MKLIHGATVGEALSLPPGNEIECSVEWYAIRLLRRGRVSRPDSAALSGGETPPLLVCNA